MRKSNSALLAAAGLMALAGAGSQFARLDGPQVATSSKAARADMSKSSPAKSVEQRSLKSLFNSSGGEPWRGKLRAKGWPVATDRRRAKKVRSVARNRAAHR